MVFITKYNASRILQQIDWHSLEIDSHIYYNRKINFFSDDEIKMLIAFKHLLQDPAPFIEEYYVKIKDTKTFIFENKPAFHRDYTCGNLYSDFNNILIPQKIKEKGDIAIEEFRKWSNAHIELYQRNIEAFRAECCLKFSLVYPTDLELVSGGNSGIDLKKNYDLVELEREIDLLIKNAAQYYYSSEMNKEILRRFRNRMWMRHEKYPVKNNYTKYLPQQIKNVLQHQYTNFNDPTFFLIKEWLRIKFNPELRFEGKLLEQLGFKNCHICYPTYIPSIKQEECEDSGDAGIDLIAEELDSLPY